MVRLILCVATRSHILRLVLGLMMSCEGGAFKVCSDCGGKMVGLAAYQSCPHRDRDSCAAWGAGL